MPAKLVRIGPFRDTVEANLAAVRLHEEGIHAHLAGEALATTLGPIYGAAYAGGPFVLVPQDEEAQARAVIAVIEQRRRDRKAAETPACPACGHRPTRQTLPRPQSWATALTLAVVALAVVLAVDWVVALVLSLVGGVLWSAFGQPFWVCPSCDKRFRAAAPSPAQEDDEPPEP